MGYLFQNYALFPHLTVLENVMMGMKIKTNSTELAVDLLKKFKVDHLTKNCPKEISSGESQRLALARMMATDPDLIFWTNHFKL